MEYEKIIKKTREVGTSSGVLLPREWLGRSVSVQLVTPNIEAITEKLIRILLKKEILKNSLGIYLIGSYARNEEEIDSDIDILVITDKINTLISEDNFEIICISEENLEKNLKNNLYFIIALKEAQPIINQKLLDYYKNKINIKKFNFRQKFREIKQVIGLNKELISQNDKTLINNIIYSLVLRVRELYFLYCLKHNKQASQKDFFNIVNPRVYRVYREIKENRKITERISISELKETAEKADKLIKKWEKRR
jgi:predicted nucleotidyltransferase